MEGLIGIDKVLRRVDRLGRDIRQAERPMRAAGTYMIGSITRNFNAGGRPRKWPKLAASTIARRRRGKGKGGVKPLIDMGQLRNSHSIGRSTSSSVEVGTNMVQAKRQHFGYPGGTGRGRSKTPARPFVMIQDEDHDAIGEILSRHLRGKG